MKILHLTTVALSHRYLLLAQLEALRDAGHEVVAVSADGPEVADLTARGIRHRALDGSTRGVDPRADLRAARSFAAILRDEKPDLVHTHNPKPGLYGRIIARALRVPRVVNTVHGLYAAPDDPLPRRALVYALEAIAGRCSHLEFVQNIEDVALMKRLRLAPPKRVLHLGNGIDLRRFGSPDPGIRAQVRAELGIGAGEIVVMAVGRLVREKGFGELFEASAAIGHPHRLVVVGPSDPEKEDALPAELIASATDRGALMLGHRDDVERLLQAADIFALPSYREGVPRAAMEAAAAHLPVVATDIRGCRQVVEQGVTGFLVPKADAGALAEALERLIGDPALRSSFGAAARTKAEAEFDENEVVRRLMSGYADLGVTPAPPD